MKVLIVNTVKDSQGGMLTGVDAAITFELYKKSRDNNTGDYTDSLNRLTANHIWSKFIFIDEKRASISTYRTMEEVCEKVGFLGNCLILTHEQWLDKQNSNWKDEPRYQYW